MRSFVVFDSENSLDETIVISSHDRTIIKTGSISSGFHRSLHTQVAMVLHLVTASQAVDLPSEWEFSCGSSRLLCFVLFVS